MKVFFIWGFLGSGKTTFINYILENVFFEEKVVILENESGDVSVDGFFLSQKNYIVKELSSGCVCCSLKMELTKAIESIRVEYSPDILLIETSGIASLESIYRIPNLRIDVVISLLDVTRYNILMKLNKNFYIRQYSISPIILLTKTDAENNESFNFDELKKQYSAGSLVIDDYRRLDKDMWRKVLTKASPFRWIGNHSSDFDFCIRRTYFLDKFVDTSFCISLIQRIQNNNKISILRSKGLLYDENGIICMYDIFEDSYSCTPLDQTTENFEGKPFVCIWWNKDVDKSLIEYFELFISAKERTYKLSSEDIDYNEIWTYMGGNNFTPSKEVSLMVDHLRMEALSVCKPVFAYRFFRGEVLDNGSLSVSGTIFTPKGIIRKCLEDSESYALIVVTVGKEMDDWLNSKHLSTDVMESFIADILGSVIVESLASHANKMLECIVGSVNWNITNSYSPGYCGWDVSEQHLLFSMLPDNICGIKLTDSSLMIPIKSISAVVGIGAKVRKKEYGCKICNKKDCFKRRI